MLSLGRKHLFVGSDLDTTDGTEGLLDVSVDGELTGSEGTDHEETGTETGEGSLESELLGDLDETGGGSLSWKTLGLVDLGEHGIGWLGDNGSGETSNQTGTQVDTGLSEIGGGGLVDNSVDSLRDLLVDDELGHGVWNLLEQDWAETGVESSDTLSGGNLGETGDKTGGELGVRDETDTGGLKWAEGDIGEELGKSRGGEVNGGTVLGSNIITQNVDRLLLEELVTSELEASLERVTSEGWSQSSEESASTLRSDDLAETTNHTLVVNSWLELDSGLDDIDWGKSTVGDTAAGSAGKSESGVEGNARKLLWGSVDSGHFFDYGIKEENSEREEDPTVRITE